MTRNHHFVASLVKISWIRAIVDTLLVLRVTTNNMRLANTSYKRRPSARQSYLVGWRATYRCCLILLDFAGHLLGFPQRIHQGKQHDNPVGDIYKLPKRPLSQLVGGMIRPLPLTWAPSRSASPRAACLHFIQTLIQAPKETKIIEKTWMNHSHG